MYEETSFLRLRNYHLKEITKLSFLSAMTRCAFAFLNHPGYILALFCSDFVFANFSKTQRYIHNHYSRGKDSKN